jgi:hypothetical protein
MGRKHKRRKGGQRMKKYLLLIVFASALTACENELKEVNEQFETRSAVEDKEQKEDVNFRIWRDRTQHGKEF